MDSETFDNNYSYPFDEQCVDIVTSCFNCIHYKICDPRKDIGEIFDGWKKEEMFTYEYLDNIHEAIAKSCNFYSQINLVEL